MKIYAISDIHGFIDELNEALSLIELEQPDTILVLLGDYIHGHDSYAVLDRVMELQKKYGTSKIIALKGNHEEEVLEGRCSISEYDDVVRSDMNDEPYLKWMRSLPLYYKTEKQIFVHAGVDEEAEDLWMHGTRYYEYFGKYPPTMGYFYMDIIAGHVGTALISGDPDFHDIYFDGQSHYYIDGTVSVSGRIPILLLDTESGDYYSVISNKNGLKRLLKIRYICKS